MPIKTYFFNHFVLASFFIGAVNGVYQNQNIEDNTTSNVGTVKASDGKKEIEKVVCRL